MPLNGETGVGRIGHTLGSPAPTAAPEKKSANLGSPAMHEVRDAMDEFMTRFDAFKQANDDRL
ncbi:MAG: hypothetical protein RLO21_18395, partial [Nitratireductor sp.]